MASGSRIHLEASQQPQYYVKCLTIESAKITSELLQANHEKHHIFFNKFGFHNHIAHHLLTLFALNATPKEIQQGYDTNVDYQRPPEPLKDSIVDDMHDPERFKTYLGKEQYYHDFLMFFQKEIDAKTWQEVLNEYVFARDERAEDLLSRMYAGFLHPIIHTGFGVEFQQPAIVAEGLAQACVHDKWMNSLFLGVEQAAEKNRSKGDRKTIVQLLEEVKKDDELSNAAHWEDGNKIRDGVMKRSPEKMVGIASQYTIREDDDLEEKTAEMINAAVYFTAAAQRPPHQVKFDFYYMHCVTSSVFFSNFLSSTNNFLTPATKRRLLEWKVWNDIVMYTSRHSPALHLSEITDYTPKQNSNWDEIILRVNKLEDDGHASKLIRALANGQKSCQPYEDKPGFVINEDMWRKIGHMAIDSVEAGEPHWTRSCGFDQAWKDVPLRDEAKL
ncbi:uncharacterized protein EKO05_0010063 [Ascochyta rabiei]|uniref:Uncharacterized protein n=1 Tax=Didymella rabiei TaxID=5454 RepID=A0A163LMQ5_DIDRA|nr:uncharacterized protein EKO05_0010063 [Ascochyta rabiei]KZM27933.1 hypothetical protein ST47_g926 [Ascochyta rabiei]UPX19812.1 hypothetical protein EKO05_0010063 [Ascochyta rabiei]